MKYSIATALAVTVSLAAAQQGSPVGYASLNGGTTGGKGGATTTVSSLPEFTAAVGKKTDTTAKGEFHVSTSCRIHMERFLLV